MAADPNVKRSELEALVEPISTAISELRDTVGQSLAELPGVVKASDELGKELDELAEKTHEEIAELRQTAANLIADLRSVARAGELAADDPDDLLEIEPMRHEWPLGLHAKMARILGLVDGIEKRGHAEVRKDGAIQYSYDYITESDLMAAIRPLLADAGIAVYYSDEILKIDTSSRGAMLVHVRVELRLVDEEGEETSLSGEAIAVDYGDKAANKAKTNAVRYLLWKTFLVPSDVDPEQDSISFQADERTAGDERTFEEVGRDATRPKGTEPAKPRPARPSQRRANLRKRIEDLAGEIDELAQREPGHTIGAIADAVRLEYGLDLDGLSDDELVSVGAQVRVFLETNRRVAAEPEPGVYPPGMPDFDLRAQIAAGDEWKAPEGKS